MKNLFFFLFLTFAFVSCKNEVSSNKAAIESLSGIWTENTNRVTAFSNEFTAEINDITTKVNSAMLTEAEVASLKGEKAEKYNKAVSDFKELSGSLSGMQNVLQSFISEWTKYSDKVQGLNSALSTGKYEGDVKATLTDLNDKLPKVDDILSGLAKKREELSAALPGILEGLEAAKK